MEGAKAIEVAMNVLVVFGGGEVMADTKFMSAARNFLSSGL